MTDLFAEDVSAEDFALPGDAAILGRETPAAEPDPVVEEAPAEPVAETEEPAKQERLRNEDGTFAPNPVDEPVAETQQADESDADYATRIAQLEQRLADKDEFIGRQSQEVAEVRRLMEQIAEKQNETPAAPPVQITGDMIDQNPAYAAQLAYEQDNGVAFAQAFEAWKEEDPFQAAAWATGKQNELQLAELERKQEERFAALQATVAPAAQTAQVAQLNTLLAAADEKNPGLLAFVASDKAAALASEFPEAAQLLVAGTPDQKVRSLQMLHQIDRGRASDTLKVTEEQVAREVAVQGQQAREDAFVASASTTTSGQTLSKAEQIGAEWDAMEAPYKDGWNL